MSIDTSYRLHVTSGHVDRRVTLPDLPGAGRHTPAMIDRVGEQLQGALPLVAAGGIAGGAIGAKLLRLGGGGIFRGIVGGIAGVLAGAGVAMTGLALARGTDHHAAPDAPATAREASTVVAAPERVKVMTYNVHGGMGGPGRFGSSEEELDRLADAIRREQPDIVLLQEVDQFAVRSNWTDTLAELDERLDPDSAVGAPATTSLFGRDQHTAVMTFNGFEITDARNIVHQDPRGAGVGLRLGATFNLAKAAADHVLGTHWKTSDSNTDYQVRNTIEAMVRTPGGSDVRVLSGHYEWPNPRFDHQQLQVGSLARSLAAWQGPTILGADFNILDGTPGGARERAMLADAGLHDTLDGVAARERVSMTSQVDDPAATRGGIDRIYASAHARVADARVVREAGTASDHLPVVAELELTPVA